MFTRLLRDKIKLDHSRSKFTSIIFVIQVFTLIILFTSCKKDQGLHPNNTDTYIKFFGKVFDENGSKLLLDANDEMYVFGTIESTNDKGNQLYITKLDAQGNKIWEADFGTHLDDQANDFIFDNQGDLLLLGAYTDSVSQLLNSHLLRVSSSDGSLIFDSLIGDTLVNDFGGRLSALNSGYQVIYEQEDSDLDLTLIHFDNSFIETYRDASLGVFNKKDFLSSVVTVNDLMYWSGSVNRIDELDMRLVKMNLYGDVLFDFDFFAHNQIEEIAVDLIQVDNSLLMLSNTSDISGLQGNNLVSTNLEGVLNWSQSLSLGAGVTLNKVIATTDGGYFVTGSQVDGSNLLGYVAKLSSDFSVTWDRNFGLEGESLAVDVKELKSGHFVVLAKSYISNSSTLAFYKYNSNGEIK